MNHTIAVSNYFLPVLVSALLCLCQPISTAVAASIYSTSGIDCFLVSSASIIVRAPDEAVFGRANVGHQIGNGAKMVLAIRAYEGLGSLDGQKFWKATLEFAALPSSPKRGETKEVRVLRSYYSNGGLTWVNDGLYEWATNPFTYFYIVQTAKGIEVRMNQAIIATHAFTGEKRSVTIVRQCPVTYRAVRQLGPWEGKVGTTWESFEPAVN